MHHLNLSFVLAKFDFCDSRITHLLVKAMSDSAISPARGIRRLRKGGSFFIPKSKRANLSNYKYSGTDKSLLSVGHISSQSERLSSHTLAIRSFTILEWPGQGEERITS